MSEFELEYEDSRINIKEAIRKIKDYNFYLKLFLCEETIANLGKFSKNTSDFRKGNSNVKDLWKDLLIDSISILKLNDTREKLNQAGFDNFQIDDKFKSIRLLNSYGIDELDKYFDDFVEFESVLYGSDSNYRDHVNHVIQVWLIGLVLLCKDENFKYLQFSDNFKLIDKSYSFDVKANDDFTPIESGKLVFYVTKSEIFAMWTIIALCHDLGYPLEKASNINQNLKNILGHFGTLNIQEFSYNFNILNNHLVEKYLNIVSSKIQEDKKILEKISVTDFYKKNKNLDEIGFTGIQSKYRDKIAKSLEDYKHGVLSGLLIYKTLTYFLETDFSYPNNLNLPYEDLRQFSIRKEILRAITGHTCPKLYHLDVRNFSFLLILCDELHEWERPRFEDFKNGPLSDDEKKIEVFVDEFCFDEAKIKSSEYDQNFKAVIRVSFVDNSKRFGKDKDVVSIERTINKKFQTLHHLLRSAKDDEKRKFLLRWKYTYVEKRKKDNIIRYVYRFRYDSSKDVYNFIKATSYLVDKNNQRKFPQDKSFDFYKKISRKEDCRKEKLDLLIND